MTAMITEVSTTMLLTVNVLSKRLLVVQWYKYYNRFGPIVQVPWSHFAGQCGLRGADTTLQRIEKGTERETGAPGVLDKRRITFRLPSAVLRVGNWQVASFRFFLCPL
jgi:hypothetical protein